MNKAKTEYGVRMTLLTKEKIKVRNVNVKMGSKAKSIMPEG